MLNTLSYPPASRLRCVWNVRSVRPHERLSKGRVGHCVVFYFSLMKCLNITCQNNAFLRIGAEIRYYQLRREVFSDDVVVFKRFASQVPFSNLLFSLSRQCYKGFSGINSSKLVKQKSVNMTKYEKLRGKGRGYRGCNVSNQILNQSTSTFLRHLPFISDLPCAPSAACQSLQSPLNHPKNSLKSRKNTRLDRADMKPASSRLLI